MTALVKHLRAVYRNDTYMNLSDAKDCADTIESLQAELNEQARLVGMGAEREAALMARVESLKKALSRYGTHMPGCGHGLSCSCGFYELFKGEQRD